MAQRILQTLLLSAISLLLLNNSALAAIAYDASNSGAVAYYSPDSSITFSLTVGSGTDRYLIVAGGNDDGGGVTCSSATYNGVSMTEAVEAGTGAHACLYYLLNPDSGTHNVVVTMSGSADISMGAVSFTGADQAAPDDSDYEETSSTTTTVNLTSTVDNSWIATLVLSENQSCTFTAGTGVTELLESSSSGTTSFALGHKATTTAGAISSVWTKNDAYGTVQVSAVLAPSGGATRRRIISFQ